MSIIPTDTNFTDFGNANTTINDPISGTTKIIKNINANTWAGSFIASEINFGEMSPPPIITMYVNSPIISVIKVKIEDLDDTNNTVDVDVTNTVTGSNELLTYDFSSPTIGTYNFNGNYTKITFFFNYGNVGAGNIWYFSDVTLTNPTPSCFNKGTKILCLNKNFEEENIPIETLRKGDIVKSYKHGYRRILSIGMNYMVNNPDNPAYCMFLLKKTDANNMTDDLIMTGGHSILVDNLGKHKEKTMELLPHNDMEMDGKYLLLSQLSEDFVKQIEEKKYNYFCFVLENDGNVNKRFGIWANGVLVETPTEKIFIKQGHYLI